MAGLLYKDFIAAKGKWYVFAMAAAFLILLSLRLMLPDEKGDVIVNLLASFIVTILFALVIFNLETSIVAADEGRKRRCYCLSLPVSKRQYVASKYVFILISFYIAISFSEMLGFLCVIQCNNEEMLNYSTMLQQIVPLMACILLLVPALELPFLICLGTGRGYLMKLGIIFGVAFLVLTYMLFGDLSILDRISMETIFGYIKGHPQIYMIAQLVIIFGILGIYYISYRITCRFFIGLEQEDD